MFLWIPAVLLSAATPPVPGAPIAPEVVVARGGLSNTFARLQRGEPVTVAYLGGSITAGAGASNASETSYRALTTRWLKTTFSAARITEINAAIGGTPSDLGAFRLERDVLSRHPDLVFVEFAVNDGGLPDARINSAMEGIVRHVWRDAPQADLCFVYTLAREHLADYARNALPRTVRLHEAIAARYAIPSVNMALVAARRINDNALAWDDFSKDSCHPTDAGYHLFAGAITDFLAAAARSPGTKPAAHTLPAPRFPGNFETATMLDFSETHLGEGWTREDKRWVGQFDHVAVAETPGATLHADFTGTVLGIFYVLGPDTGAFEYRVDDGPWKPCDPFDPWAVGSHRAHSRMLETDLPPGPHRVTIRTLAAHHKDSKGTVTRLGYLLTDGRTK